MTGADNMRRRSAPMNDRQWGMSTSLGSRIPLASLIQTLAVAEHLSFHRAANALGISQPSVSARIRTPEEDLGVRLFERSTRGVRLPVLRPCWAACQRRSGCWLIGAMTPTGSEKR
ncbi:helix-turn-helix domain-containing protein [Brucella anthropi]|uniref:helix-turn-helix domain-containing protein n=1 Tax=Brucella anthropi TaxID=529 RepID=UPI004032A794